MQRRPDLISLAAPAAALAVAAAGPCPEPLRAEIWLAGALALLGWRRCAGSGARRLLWTLAVACLSHALQDSAQLRADAIGAQITRSLAADDRCEVGGTIAESGSFPRGIAQVVLEIETLACAGAPHPARGRLLLTLPSTGDLRPGDRLRAFARLAPIRPAGNPGIFDSGSLLLRRGIFLSGSVKSAKLCQVERRAPQQLLVSGEIFALAGRIRLLLEQRLERAAAHLRRPHPATAPLLTAMLLGQRTGIDPGLMRSLQASGLYHLVAISGLHIVLLGWIFLRGAAAAGAPPRPAAACVAVLLGAYVMIAGAPASALRALAMLLLWEAGRWSGRRAGGASLVATAGALLILPWPGLAGDAGFWLSLVATLGLTGASAQAGALRRALGVSLAAYLAVAPLEALWFQRWTPVGIILNLAAVPLSTVLLLGAAALAALGVDPASAPAAAAALEPVTRCVALVVDWGVRTLEALSATPLTALEVFRIPPPPAALLVAHLGAAVALRCGAVPGPSRGRGWLPLLAAAHLALICPASPQPERGIELTLWEVGQGESGLLRLPDGSAILVDAAGRDRQGQSLMERRVLPALRASGVRRLRALALSHLDADHAAGAEELMRAMRPASLWVPAGLEPGGLGRLAACARASGTQVEILTRGKRRRLGGASILVLWPERRSAPRRGDNSGSLVLRVESADGSILLTGDLEAPEEKFLTTEGLLPAAILKVSHHGSRSSSDPLFLRAARPRLALISAGARNAWGHPHPEALQRLRRTGAWIASTSGGGAVRGRLRGGEARLERFHGRRLGGGWGNGWLAGGWERLTPVSASPAPARTRRSRPGPPPPEAAGAWRPEAAGPARADGGPP